MKTQKVTGQKPIKYATSNLLQRHTIILSFLMVSVGQEFIGGGGQGVAWDLTQGLLCGRFRIAGSWTVQTPSLCSFRALP